MRAKHARHAEKLRSATLTPVDAADVVTQPQSTFTTTSENGPSTLSPTGSPLSSLFAADHNSESAHASESATEADSVGYFSVGSSEEDFEDVNESEFDDEHKDARSVERPLVTDEAISETPPSSIASVSSELVPHICATDGAQGADEGTQQ
eukprot:SAG31_NODE_12323_length_949_cov_1.804706_1_plen_150_part_10